MTCRFSGLFCEWEWEWEREKESERAEDARNDDDIDSVEYSKILGAVPVDNQSIIEFTGYRPRLLFFFLSLS